VLEPIEEVVARNTELEKEVERLRVQLAGCETAAKGGPEVFVLIRPGDYVWSSALQAVLEMRQKLEALRPSGSHP
jgi:hypothetical protein